jgi:hypothetical protein
MVGSVVEKKERRGDGEGHCYISGSLSYDCRWK